MTNLVGQILIAPPHEADASRADSVVFVTTLYQQYHLGLRLNNKSHMSVNELAANIGYKLDVPGYVYSGGMHSLNSLTLLHTVEWSCGTTIPINNFVSISSNVDIIKEFANGSFPRKWKIFLGIHKWMPGQLESEICGIKPYSHELSWCLLNSSEELIFDTSPYELWDTSITTSAYNFSKNFWT